MSAACHMQPGSYLPWACRQLSHVWLHPSSSQTSSKWTAMRERRHLRTANHDTQNKFHNHYPFHYVTTKNVFMCVTCLCSDSTPPSLAASAGRRFPSPPWCWSWRCQRSQSTQCSQLADRLDLWTHTNKSRFWFTMRTKRVVWTCVISLFGLQREFVVIGLKYVKLNVSILNRSLNTKWF